MKKVAIGDWVRFYSNGALKIGVVNYIKQHEILDEREIQTDAGCVDEDDILEVRKP